MIVDADGERTDISWTQVAGEYGLDNYVESIGNSTDGRYLEFTYPYAIRIALRVCKLYIRQVKTFILAIAMRTLIVT